MLLRAILISIFISAFNIAAADDAFEKARGLAKSNQMQDVLAGYDALQQLANAGDQRANHELGLLYYHGHGKEVSYKQALTYFELAANKGYAPSQFNLAHMYLKGQGTDRDLSKAEALFGKAYANGDLAAGYELATLALANAQNKIAKAEAEQRYEKLAEQGFPRAIYMVGTFEMEKSKVDFGKALQYFEKAASLGVLDAYYNVGLMHYNGWGTPKNAEKAAEIFENAALQGQRNAMHNLGMLYFFGKVKPFDENIGRAWVYLSKPDAERPAFLKSLKGKTSDANIKKVEQLAAEFEAKIIATIMQKRQQS